MAHPFNIVTSAITGTIIIVSAAIFIVAKLRIVKKLGFKILKSKILYCAAYLALMAFIPTGFYRLIAIIISLFIFGLYTVYFARKNSSAKLISTPLSIYLWLLSLYTFPYVILSYFGGYTLSGNIQYEYQESPEFEYDARRVCPHSGACGWQPAFIYFEYLTDKGVRCNKLGFVYLPLINLDYALWHQRWKAPIY